LVERELMEDLAHTAAEIAQRADPTGRLPIADREGRLRELTVNLNRMLEHLELALTRERQLVGHAADELRVPIRTIREQLAGSADGDRDDLAARRRDLLVELDHASSVLNEMAAIAIVGEPATVRPVPIILEPFLADVGRRGRAFLDGRLSVPSAPTGAFVQLDAEWVRRALLRLLDNAAAHSVPEGSVELRVVRVPDGWRFEVCDHGGGVPAGHEDAIFAPFYRVPETSGRPGLGLALVRSVAHAHGGSAGVVNRPGLGATFWLRIPD
jgi:two-component system OmpR family sensor kinase